MNLTTDGRTLVEYARQDLRAGSPPQEVVEMLVSNGVPIETAEQVVRDLCSRSGVGAALVGAAVVAVGLLCVAFGIYGMLDESHAWGHRPMRTLGFGVMLLFSGAYVKGLP
ncbi:MAG: hypothetical protein ABMB14_22320 [Myxococcota bacterium]